MWIVTIFFSKQLSSSWKLPALPDAALLDGLQPSLKNARQKIPPNSPKVWISLRNFTTQSFSVLPIPFWLNVSKESNKTNVSLFSNDGADAMTFSAHLPMNLAVSGLSSAQP